jgi:hypothetical protein
MCVFVAAVTFLPSRCLVTIQVYMYRHTDWREGLMKYAVELGLVAVIRIPSFVNTGSGIQKFNEGDTRTHSMVLS